MHFIQTLYYIEAKKQNVQTLERMTKKKTDDKKSEREKCAKRTNG